MNKLELEELFDRVNAYSRHTSDKARRAKFKVATELVRYLDYVSPGWRDDVLVQLNEAHVEVGEDIHIDILNLSIILERAEIRLTDYVKGGKEHGNTKPTGSDQQE